MGIVEGNKEAAKQAFKKFAIAAGDALANAATLVDGLIVLGGGIAGAHPLFFTTFGTRDESSFQYSGW